MKEKLPREPQPVTSVELLSQEKKLVKPLDNLFTPSLQIPKEEK